MDMYSPCMVKSFKHNGHLHRVWLENWLIPDELLHPEHLADSMKVIINSQTKIKEANGKEWVSKIPGITFFLPNQWYNIVALIEEAGIRYYCNVASPFYHRGETITYIDYDLDVIVMPNREYRIVDQDEYELHKARYFYSDTVDRKVKDGLASLMERVLQNESPFCDDIVHSYFSAWQETFERQK